MPEKTSRHSPDDRYGPWKMIHEIELEDLLVHPIWVWCMEPGLPDEEDGPLGGDETSMRPLLKSNEVPPHTLSPLILLRVSGTNLYASGFYNGEKKFLEDISIYSDGEATAPALVPGLPNPLTYIAVPTIDGRDGVHFESVSASSEAKQL